MDIATASMPFAGPLALATLVACLVASIVLYAVAWWRVLEDKPNPLVHWRSPIARRKS